MKGFPWIKFYPRDWITDTRVLTINAKGAWVDILCVLHGSETRGVSTMDVDQWGRSIGASSEETGQVIRELARSGVADVANHPDGKVTITCRRMKREERDRNGNANRQKKYRENGGGDPERWTAIRVDILRRDEYVCAYCGRKAATVDHILPRSRGGDENPHNLVACCYKCNGVKGNRTPEEAGMTLKFDSRETEFDLNNGKSNGTNNDETSQEKRGRSQKPEARSIDPILSAGAEKGQNGKNQKAREKNPLIEAIVFCHCGTIEGVPNVTWKFAQRALTQIKAVAPEVTPEEIKRRWGNMKLRFDGDCSPAALVKWWVQCDSAPAPIPGTPGPAAPFKLPANMR